MTTDNQTLRRVYNGDDATTNFPVTIFYTNVNQIEAVLRASDGTETVQVINTHYTLTAPNPTDPDLGGTLTMITPPATGETLIITVSIPYTQDTPYPLGGTFPSTDVENSLDRIIQIGRQLEERIDRTLSVPATADVTTPPTVPTPTTGRALVWAADGNLENSDQDPDEAANAAAASAAAAATSASNAATSETNAASSASAAQTAQTGAETAETGAEAALAAAQALVAALDQFTIPVWSNTEDYVINNVVEGSDGTIYIATAASGPSSTVADPTDPGSIPTPWDFFVNHLGPTIMRTDTNATLTASFYITADTSQTISSGVFTPNFLNRNQIEFTVDATITNFANPATTPPGGGAIIYATQDGTGGHGITFDSSYNINSGTWSTTAGVVNQLRCLFQSNGTINVDIVQGT